MLYKQWLSDLHRDMHRTPGLGTALYSATQTPSLQSKSKSNQSSQKKKPTNISLKLASCQSNILYQTPPKPITELMSAIITDMAILDLSTIPHLICFVTNYYYYYHRTVSKPTNIFTIIKLINFHFYVFI